jgi:glycine/D-amino acid oxidase-like deaminating enzyme
MTRTKIPVGLPHPNPTKAYWQTPPLPISDHRSFANLPQSAQYVIVGSGVSGASIAYKLLQANPSASIVMLEARQTCSGATGRNGGHCRAGRYLEFKEYLEEFGEEDSLLMEKLEEENVKNVGEFIKTFGIDCDLRDVETVDIFTDRKQWDGALESLKARKDVLKGHVEANILTKHRVWSAKETREELLIPEGIGAISFRAYKLSPYKFVCKMLEMCLIRGLNLQTNTPVLEVSQAPDREGKKNWLVHTHRGVISTENVILATNAYTSFLYAPLSEFIIPTRGQVLAIRPGSNIAGNPALLRTAGLNSAISDDYVHARSEGTSGAGDLIVGKWKVIFDRSTAEFDGIGGGRRLGTHGEQPILDDSTIHPIVSKYLIGACPAYFGRDNWGEDGQVLQEWTGIMAYTSDAQPIVGEAPGHKGLFISAGFNGHGKLIRI